jgi:hypothetical protein
MTDWTKRRDARANEYAKSEKFNNCETATKVAAQWDFQAGYDQARADMLEALGEFDESEVKYWAFEKRMTADVERWSIQACRWQFEQIKKKLGLG